MLSASALDDLPEIAAGMDLGAAIAERATLHGGEVVVVAHKVVSKAEGRVRRLDEVEPGERAHALAAEQGKDPRHVQVVLDETQELLRAERGVLICVTHHGFVCANAGVDASNAAADEAGGNGSVILLPVDPDASARRLRAGLQKLTGVAPAVLITDSFGRAWRHGQTDVAIGAAGIAPLEDWRGRADGVGRGLRATWIALADQIAGAADLARSKDSRQPVVVVSGLDRHVLPAGEDGPGAAALLRPASEDLFR
jgi:coenzyme F420-0:L-glutamate ligase / coenzyme F420-1:gamma-L-glutamate ligase